MQQNSRKLGTTKTLSEFKLIMFLFGGKFKNVFLWLFYFCFPRGVWRKMQTQILQWTFSIREFVYGLLKSSDHFQDFHNNNKQFLAWASFLFQVIFAEHLLGDKCYFTVKDICCNFSCTLKLEKKRQLALCLNLLIIKVISCYCTFSRGKKIWVGGV